SYSISNSHYQVLTSSAISGSFGSVASLADSNTFLFRDRRGISLCDWTTKKPQLLLPVAGYFIARSFNVSSDDRFITYSETATQGDSWLVEFQTAAQAKP